VEPLQIVVRVLEESDIPAIERTEPPGQGFARAMWRRQQLGDSLLLVAWIESEPAGSGQLDRSAPRPELKNLNVREQRRGRGVGAAIIAEAERLARDAGELGIGVGIDNPRARALYERLGYVATGELTTTTYDYVGTDGATRTATETDELLVKRLD
jgi:GNAT superfamily N-acetyltransferase